MRFWRERGGGGGTWSGSLSVHMPAGTQSPMLATIPAPSTSSTVYTEPAWGGLWGFGSNYPGVNVFSLTHKVVMLSSILFSKMIAMENRCSA